MNGFFKWFKSGAKIKRWILLMLIGMVLEWYGISKVLVTDVMGYGEHANIRDTGRRIWYKGFRW